MKRVPDALNFYGVIDEPEITGCPGAAITNKPGRPGRSKLGAAVPMLLLLVIVLSRTDIVPVRLLLT